MAVQSIHHTGEVATNDIGLTTDVTPSESEQATERGIVVILEGDFTEEIPGNGGEGVKCSKGLGGLEVTNGVTTENV